MAAVSVLQPFPIFTDRNGTPLDDGYVYLGTVNLNPVSNPITAYWDAALTITASQPIRTLAGYPVYNGAPGRLYVNADDYSIQVKDKRGRLIYTALSSTQKWSLANTSGTLASSAITTGMGSGSGTLASYLNGQRTNVRDFGVTLDGVTDDTDAWQAAFDSGEPLWMPPGTSLVFGTGGASPQGLLAPANLDLLGAGQYLSRIEKRFFEESDYALIQPADLVTGANNVIIRSIGLGCEPGVYESGGTRSGKIINTGLSQGWQIEDVYVNHWNGWGISLGGRNNAVRRVVFDNPYTGSGGVDGVHIYACDDITLPHIVEDISGTTHDDMVGVFPIAAVGSGALYNLDILGAHISNVTGTSSGARILAIGFSTTIDLSATIAHIHARGIQGKGTISANGAVAIINTEAGTGPYLSTTVMRDIDIEADVDGTDCKAYLDIRGPKLNVPNRMSKIRVDITSMHNTTGPTGAGTAGIFLTGHIDKLNLSYRIDASNADNGILWNEQYGSGNFTFDGNVTGGSAGDVITFPTALSATDGVAFSNGVIRGTIAGVSDTHRGLNLEAAVGTLKVEGVRFTIASGATSATGIYEAGDCDNNVFHNCDLSTFTGGTNAAVGLAQDTSDYFNNLGFVTEKQGTATLLNGATSVNVTHGMGYIPTRAEINIIWNSSYPDTTTWGITTVNSTIFTVTVPGAVGGDRLFAWSIRRMKQ